MSQFGRDFYNNLRSDSSLTLRVDKHVIRSICDSDIHYFIFSHSIIFPAVQLQSKPEMQTFSGLMEGDMLRVIIKFEADPKPTEGVWKVAGTEVALGGESSDRNFRASQVMDAEEESIILPR